MYIIWEKKWKSKDKFTLPYQVIIYAVSLLYDRSFLHFCHFYVLSYLYYNIREERIPVLRSFTKEDILYIGHFRKYSNCMLYFHILTYKQGTSEAHFVAKWQHLLHSYQYNVCHIVWIIYMGYVYNRLDQFIWKQMLKKIWSVDISMKFEWSNSKFWLWLFIWQVYLHIW